MTVTLASPPLISDAGMCVTTAMYNRAPESAPVATWAANTWIFALLLRYTVLRKSNTHISNPQSLCQLRQQSSSNASSRHFYAHPPWVFFGNIILNYVILSHRWEGEEVTFQDLQAGRAPGMKGFLKIKGCCAQAVADSFLYAWVDSCCIDKTSSAELSEAINFIFYWYERSQVCYAYLSDMSVGLD
jgi:hypothetical protein